MPQPVHACSNTQAPSSVSRELPSGAGLTLLSRALIGPQAEQPPPTVLSHPICTQVNWTTSNLGTQLPMMQLAHGPTQQAGMASIQGLSLCMLTSRNPCRVPHLRLPNMRSHPRLLQAALLHGMLPKQAAAACGKPACSLRREKYTSHCKLALPARRPHAPRDAPQVILTTQPAPASTMQGPT